LKGSNHHLDLRLITSSQHFQQAHQEARRLEGNNTMMKLLTLLLAAALTAPTAAFTTTPPSRSHRHQSTILLSTVEEVVDAAADGAGSSEPKGADDAIPTNLPSGCGKDYIPLANMLATGEFAQADQVRGCLSIARPTTRNCFVSNENHSSPEMHSLKYRERRLRAGNLCILPM
jgi:hypothetical protein